MWWFLVLTFGSSIVPVYVAPMGPFDLPGVCESVRKEVEQIGKSQSRVVKTIECWKGKQ